jgi:hypothetical protein
MDSSNIVLSISSNEDLTTLLEIADQHKENAPADIVKIDALPGNTSYLAAGIPEITQLIIALGSSGAILAMRTILTTYFAKRPRGRLTIERTSGKSSSTRIIIENSDAATLKSLFDHIKDV